jgi:hypothetical protein
VRCSCTELIPLLVMSERDVLSVLTNFFSNSSGEVDGVRHSDVSDCPKACLTESLLGRLGVLNRVKRCRRRE